MPVLPSPWRLRWSVSNIRDYLRERREEGGRKKNKRVRKRERKGGEEKWMEEKDKLLCHIKELTMERKICEMKCLIHSL